MRHLRDWSATLVFWTATVTAMHIGMTVGFLPAAGLFSGGFLLAGFIASRRVA